MGLQVYTDPPANAEEQKEQFEGMAAFTEMLAGPGAGGKSFMEEVADSVAAAAQEELTDAKGDAEQTNLIKNALPSVMSGDSASAAAFWKTQTEGPHALESASNPANTPFTAASIQRCVQRLCQQDG